MLAALTSRAAHLPCRLWPSATLLALSLAATTPALAADVDTSAGALRIDLVADGFDEPWALDFLPDGAMLVTERDGRLTRIAPDGARTALTGLPEVFAEGQGGLLDVMVPRGFAQDRLLWLSFAAPVGQGAATAAGLGRLSDDGTRIEGFETVFLADPARGGRHFGARLVEAPDGSVFLTTGDRGTGPEGMQSQDPASAIGKLIRLSRDGQGKWSGGLHSLGHRNIQGAALDQSGRLWTVEHGAQGGDELNAPEAGRNYGWPVISYGQNYGGGQIGEGTGKPGLEQPVHVWDPSIAPSGLTVYSGALIPQWRGDLLFGSLNSDFLGRLDPDRTAPGGFAEERITSPQTGRVRDVVEGPDGAIWFLSVYDGAVYRMAPAP